MTASKNRTVLSAPAGKQEVFITREFDAPRGLVFKAYIDPALYVQWLGPHGFTTKLDKFEPTSGGRWRYVQTDPQGNQFGFHGVYHEVLDPSRIIDTFEFEGLPEPGHVILETVRFDENGNPLVVRDPKGQTITSAFDELNRLKKKSFAFAEGDGVRPWRYTA